MSELLTFPDTILQADKTKHYSEENYTFVSSFNIVHLHFGQWTYKCTNKRVLHVVEKSICQTD